MYATEGEVTFIDSQVQPTTGVIKARAVFPNAEGRIMPGQYVRLFVEGDILKNAILIPQKCVVMTRSSSLCTCENMLLGQPGKNGRNQIHTLTALLHGRLQQVEETAHAQ